MADVANFYDSIPHDLLGDTLMRLTGLGEEVEALIGLLSAVMGRPRGLPQGVAASDPLATAYLSQVDRAMLREGFTYFRHGDDIRVPVPSYSEGRRAIAVFETELRELWLAPNPDKCKILKRATYRGELDNLEDARAHIEEQVREVLVEELLGESGDDRLEELLEAAGVDDETLWGFFYHDTVDVDDLAEVIRPLVKPDRVDVAVQMFRDTVERAPVGGSNKLPREAFHARLTSSLTLLTSAKSTAALDDVVSLLRRFPDETRSIADYLSALCEQEAARVAEAIDELISGPSFVLPWQSAWFLRVLQCAPSEIRTPSLRWASEIAANEQYDWIARVEAAKLLAILEVLEENLFRRMWALCPRPYRSDLVEAAFRLRSTAQWAERWLAAVNDSPIVRVVLNHLEATSS